MSRDNDPQHTVNSLRPVLYLTEQPGIFRIGSLKYACPTAAPLRRLAVEKKAHVLVVHDPNVNPITLERGDLSAAPRQSRLCRVLILTNCGCRAALVLAVQAVWAFFFTANPLPEEHEAPPPTALRTLSFLAIVATPLLIPFCMPLLLSPLTLPLGIVAIYLLLWECGRAKVSGYAPASMCCPWSCP